MDEYTKYIILMHLHWIKIGFTKKDIQKIHFKVTDEYMFENVTMKRMQNKTGGLIEYQNVIQTSDFEKITCLYLNYSEHILDLSFLKYCVNLEEITIKNQKLKNLDVLENLENIKFIDARDNDIENIDILYSFKTLEELDLERNPIRSLKAITHLKKLRKVNIDEINNENEVVEILKNNKICSVNYIIKGNDTDFENFIFPKYHIILSKKENTISIDLEATTDEYKIGTKINFPKELGIQPDFKDRYITKIKHEAIERLVEIIGNTIQINDKQMFYDMDYYWFQYKHDLV
ncbi:leucine-rich repeat domain-containing protein [Flavobacterium sp. 83]|uniref:leucine-rich repeat domain-containing protein n=1 Tax=Flavobacterium sp. 83 TaxID=1131812 RepID=UPI00054EF170|nr:leucine-rich repeat domain-containing protein [Flavobacterium sp. 83]